MQIKKIRIKNIKSYIEQTIEFSEGINFISGANGAGKTTLIESIAYALFDCKPYHPIRLFIRNGRAVGQIDVWFEANDEREYKITRKFGRGSSQWTVYDVGTDNEICDSPADVRDWLNDFIEIEPGISLDDLFKNVIGVQQGSFTSPFSLSPNDRKKLFDTILKVDNYKNAFEKTREAEAIFRNELDKIELLIDEKSKQIERYDEIKEAFNQVSEGISQAKTKIGYIDGKLEVDLRAWDKLESLKTRLQKCVDGINKMNTRLGILKTKLEQAERDIEESQSADKALDQSREGYKTYVKLEEKISELEIKRKKRDQLRRQANRLERNIAVQQTRIQTKESDYKKHRSELQDEQSKNQINLEKLAEKIESQTYETRRFSEKFAHLKNVFKKLDDLGMSLDELKSKRSQIELKIDRRDRLYGEVRRLEKSLWDYDTQKAIADKLPAIESQLQAKQKEVEQISTQIRLAKSNKEKAKGGMCPLLGERCQNIGGKDLEEYFTQQAEELALKLREPQEQIEQLESERQSVQSAKDNLIRLNQNREKLDALNEELKISEKSISDITTKLELEKIEKLIQVIEKVRGKPEKASSVGKVNIWHRKVRFARKKDPAEGYAMWEKYENEKTGKRENETRNTQHASCFTHHVSRFTHQYKGNLGNSDGDTLLIDLLKVESALESYVKSTRKAFEEEHEKISDEFSIVQLKLQRVKTEQDSLNGRQKKIELELIELEKAKQELSYEKKELYSKIARLNRHEEEISSFGNLDDQLEAVRNQLNEHRAAYQSYVKNEDIAEKLVARQHKAFGLKKQIDLTEKRLEELENTKKQIESQFTKRGKGARRGKRTSLLIGGTEGGLGQVGDVDSFYLFEELASLQELISEKKQEKIRQQTTLENLVKEKRMLSDELSRIDTIRKEISELKSKLDRYEKGYHIIRFIRFQLLNRAGEEIADRYVRSISVEASRIYREVSKENVMLDWSKDYELTLTNKEGKRTRKRTFKQLSGGEQMTAALAVRMALLNTLSKVRFGIFDEPTINMDRERRDNFAQAVSALTDNFNQLFIISHDDTFDAITEKVIMIEKTEKDGSVVMSRR